MIEKYLVDVMKKYLSWWSGPVLGHAQHGHICDMADSSLQRFCVSCQFILEILFRFCSNCGKPYTEVAALERSNEESLIRYYFSCGFAYQGIVKILEKRHKISVSYSTLKLRLKEYNLKRRGVSYDEDIVHQRVAEILNGPGCIAGYRTVWHQLRKEGIQVPRLVVQHKVKELDPEGCAIRSQKVLRRRKYHNPGPNHVWHIDGYDKLKQYGFPVHGAIDGWSRKIMCL